MDNLDEKTGAQIDVNMENSEMMLDNLTLLKELNNIVNVISNEEFLDIVPKSKFNKVKWIPTFNCLKQSILEDMIQELNSMWEYENMPQKLEILERQKEKYEEKNMGQSVWRPQVGDVKAQLKAREVEKLQKEKTSLESLVRDYEAKVNRLKKVLPAKRAYLKALEMDIQKYQKKNEEFILKMNEKFENHCRIVKALASDHIDLNLDNEEDERDWSVDNTKEI